MAFVPRARAVVGGAYELVRALGAGSSGRARWPLWAPSVAGGLAPTADSTVMLQVLQARCQPEHGGALRPPACRPAGFA